MNREEKLKMLQSLDEKTLTEKILIPLFSDGMGCKNVHYNHGMLEFGKDIVYYTEDEFGNRKYTGVQVKREKITPRVVDTIFRQINEAFGGPFTDWIDGEKKDLDRFVLVTSKEFTEGAKESLSRSLKNINLLRDVTLVDGNQLVSLLDEHFPSAFWEEYDFFFKCFNAMKKEFETIKDISAIGQKESIPLEEIYVSLKLSEKREEILRKKEIEKVIIERNWIFREKKCRKEKTFNADNVTRVFDKVVITGTPGSGKTTLLKHLALKNCKENLERSERTIMPILITLRQCSESGKDLREYINNVFERYSFPEAKDFIEEDLRNGRCLLLLDGFDELASIERQKKITKEIEEFVRTYSKNKFIVTSRIAGYHNELKGFENLEIMEFNDAQINQFIINWFGKTNPEKAKSMGKAIKENERIRTLARNPLMVAVIAVIYEEDKQLPQRRVKLYERCVEVLLSRWDVQRKIKNKYDAEAKEKILRRLALEAHLTEKRSFTKKEILKRFSEYLPEVNIRKEMAGNVLNEIVQRNVLLKEISIGVYEFLHLSFQEYLVALELREKKDYDTLLEHLYDPWWEEVLLLFAGFGRDATDLILKIQEAKDEKIKEDIFYRNLLLRGRCITDADYTSIQLRNQIINDLWSLYETSEFYFLRQRAIKILSSIKPDNIVDLVIEKFKDKDSSVRQYAAEVLGEIGSERAVGPLIEALSDEDRDVRWSAAYALGEIGSEKTIDYLIKALETDEDGDVRQYAAEALGLTGSERAVDPLIKALSDEGGNVRQYAAEALGLIGSERAVDPLIKALSDEGGDVRQYAAEALGEIGSERAVDPLIKALETDENLSVREMATCALVAIGGERAIDPLIKALETDEDGTDEDNYVRGNVAYWLGLTGSERAVDPLIKALEKDEDIYVRGNAACGLGLTGSEKAIDPLIKALSDEGGDVRRSAACGLGRIGSEKAIDPLIKALSDEGGNVRQYAAEALGLIGSEKAIDPLIKALEKDESDSVRDRAAYALGRIGSEKAAESLQRSLKDEGKGDFGKVKDSAFYSLERIIRNKKGL